MVIYTGNRPDGEAVRSAVRSVGAKITEDEWFIRVLPDLAEAENWLAEKPLVDLAVCDATGDGALDWVQHLRARLPDCRIMLVSDDQVSPLQYLRPQIMASSLILKPYKRTELEAVLEEFIRARLEERVDEGQSLVIKYRGERTVIPYDRIYYLEAREKKVFAHLDQEEYGFYETLEGLAGSLPDYFVRTHRSFLVNRHMIEQVSLQNSVVNLRDGFQVPLSRSYKSEIKEFLA